MSADIPAWTVALALSPQLAWILIGARVNCSWSWLYVKIGLALRRTPSVFIYSYGVNGFFHSDSKLGVRVCHEGVVWKCVISAFASGFSIKDSASL